MFSKISKPSLLILSLLLLSLTRTVRSDPTPPLIKLPTDDIDDNQVCSRQEPAEKSCPVKCFRPDPVCGENGVTYWCGCADAHCSGTRVAKLGFCQVGSGGSGPLSGQALLLVHMVWLIVVGFSVLCGLL